jgi:hypothetical protein
VVLSLSTFPYSLMVFKALFRSDGVSLHCRNSQTLRFCEETNLM